MTNEELKEALLVGRPVEWHGPLEYQRGRGVIDAIIYTRDGDFSGRVRVSARITDSYGRQLTVLGKELYPVGINEKQEALSNG